MTNENYKKLYQKKTDNSPILKNTLIAAAIGGAFCCVGQGISDIFDLLGFGKDEIGVIVPSLMIFIGVFLTGIGIYDKIAKFGGAGTLVPITGFANAIASAAIEFKTEGFVFGVGAKMFVIAGPVIVYGVSASVIYGLIYWLIKVLIPSL